MPRTRTKHTHTLSTTAVPSTFTDSLPLPTIIVFDLDYTLWPFWVDTHVSGPVKPAVPTSSQAKDNNSGIGQINTKMLDRWGEGYMFYPQVPSILAAARERGIVMSLASRTHAPELAEQMLRGLQIAVSRSDGKEGAKPVRAWDFFTHPQIYPGSKTTHFRKIQQQLGKSNAKTSALGTGNDHGYKQGQVQGRTIPFEDMLFFDDEGRNRNVETDLGVTFKMVPDGVDCNEVDRGVWEWRKRRGITPKDLPEGEQDGVAELEG